MTLGNSNIEELMPLPDSGQVSDDFVLYQDGKEYHAIRGRTDGKLSFNLVARSKWGVIAKAVDTIDRYLTDPKNDTRLAFTIKEFDRKHDSNS